MINIEAEYFLKILRKGLKTHDSEVMRFCKKHILPLYLNAVTVEEAKSDAIVIKMYQSIGD